MRNDILILNNIMAKHLWDMGFEMVNFRPDAMNKIATVFYFKRTPELEKYIKEQYDLDL